jgi:hypothetical protein
LQSKFAERTTASIEAAYEWLLVPGSIGAMAKLQFQHVYAPVPSQSKVNKGKQHENDAAGTVGDSEGLRKEVAAFAAQLGLSAAEGRDAFAFDDFAPTLAAPNGKIANKEQDKETGEKKNKGKRAKAVKGHPQGDQQPPVDTGTVSDAKGGRGKYPATPAAASTQAASSKRQWNFGAGPRPGD